MNRSILVHAALCLLALFVPAPAGDAALRPPLLERRLTLDLWGSNLNEAVRALMEQTGAEIVFYRPDFPASQAGALLYLVSGEVSLRTALECLGRRYGFRYRVSESGRVELSKGYGWVKADDFAVRFPRLDRLAGSGEADADAVRRILAELVKPLPLLADSFSLAVSRTPNPDGSLALKAEAVLPPVLAEYFDKAVACLAGETDGDAVPSGGGAVAHHQRLDLGALLGRDVAVPREAEVRAALGRLARDAGVAVMLESRPTAAAHDIFQNLAGDRAGLGQALAEAAGRLGLERRVVLAAGAVSLESGRGGDWETDLRSREIFWTGLAVAGFDAARAAGRHGGGEALVAALRRRVFPTLWRDPAAAAAYSPATGRLVVIAPANAVAETGRFLAGAGGPEPRE